MATTSSILSIPFRKGAHLSLSSVVKQYINSNYDQHPDMFRQDLEVIDALRRDAVNVQEPHFSGIKKLQAYAAQLVWIGGKFPIDIGAEFTWYLALGYNADRPMVRNNLKYELLNVLYNLAALYSQLAISSPRNSTEGLRTAASYFSQAAGVLSHMQKEVLPELRMPDPPEDMDSHTLESLVQLFLAQSQECYWQKAVMDRFKDGTIAKLAARASDLYDLAGEAAVKSDSISSAWIRHMSAKHHHFAAAAQCRAASECLEKRKFGEEIARLQDALNCVNEGLREARGGYLNRLVVEDMQGLKRKLEEDLKRAEKDNDVIYLQAVPPKPELEPLGRVDMTALKIPKEVENPYDFIGEKAEFGPALFSRLVPFSVHIATTIYEERRDRLVNTNLIQQLEVLTENVHTTLATLGLPGSLQALEKPLGLPHSLVQHAEEIRQSDAISRVQKTLADIEKLRAADMAVYEEGMQILAAEEEEDSRLRLKYGTDRWARPTSKEDAEGSKIWGTIEEINSYFSSSLSSDNTIREKFESVKDLLALLAGPDRPLLDFVPSSRRTDIPESLKPVIGRLRGAYNDVLRLESRRRKKVDLLREKCRTDDIKPDILKEAARLERTYPATVIVPAHFEDFFEKRLDRLYEPELEALDKESDDQERLLNEVTRINREFESQKRIAGDKGTRDREQTLQRLDNAYMKYKEVANNLEQARRFYNDLSRIVGQLFRDRAKNWANLRRADASRMEEELSLPPLSTLTINRTPMHSPPASTYQQNPNTSSYFPPQPPPQAQQQGPSAPLPEAQIQSWANAPPQQPKPVTPGGGVWNPEMGIKFAGPSGASAAANQQGGGTWDPGSGIKFG